MISTHSFSVTTTQTQTNISTTTTTTTATPAPTNNENETPGATSELSTEGSSPTTANNNVTGIAIGAVLGGLALLCACGIMAVWLLRRYRERHSLNGEYNRVSQSTKNSEGSGTSSAAYGDGVNGGGGEEGNRYSEAGFAPRELTSMRSPAELPIGRGFGEGLLRE
jgi:hypothetical protein